jgi:pimeloyl-ACP methyl ester carboxylesterase
LRETVRPENLLVESERRREDDVRSRRFEIWICGVLLGIATPVLAAPCVTVQDCTEWITLRSGPARLLVYRSVPLESTNPAITRAVVVVHGAGRDADNYFRHMLAAAFLAGALENTVVISPKFASNNGEGCADTVAALEARWECNGPRRWTAGGGAIGNESVTSFDAMDDLLARLAARETLPNLQIIVLAGHSAGGQFVSRYQMANRLHDTLTVPLTYIVANPSSYAYLDATRPSATVLAANVSALAPGYVVALPAAPPAPFVPFGDARNCTTYDNWPYGLQQRVGYAANLTDDQLKQQASSRRTIYLLGGLDILPLSGFDGSCAAMAQGPTRLARGLAYGQYLNGRFGAKHEVRVVPLCGHNARCMFTDNAALALLFPKQ